ncbi:hypothetical protein EYF80_062502 [Liparis tanakae]|uniref:Uncharacterized protein n=1 Tax=Liparis tanakae TaxID=230148 RepID=A0A4Z2EFW3_9TELE|nr:hypothetical protein EYF80_062502 [Liparis tanakae]
MPLVDAGVPLLPGHFGTSAVFSFAASLLSSGFISGCLSLFDLNSRPGSRCSGPVLRLVERVGRSAGNHTMAAGTRSPVAEEKTSRSQTEGECFPGKRTGPRGSN